MLMTEGNTTWQKESLASAARPPRCQITRGDQATDSSVGASECHGKYSKLARDGRVESERIRRDTVRNYITKERSDTLAGP